MVPRVGEKVGPYEILGRLGSGGMGLVFSAWDARLQRDVAIKLLREEYLNPGMRSRFLQEARAASRLNHPNICTVFDIGEQQGDPFLVMELLKGETVRSRITRDSLSLDDTLCVAREVTDALIVAHAQGVVHRDIKPANIMLVPKGGGGIQSKVLDFGLAKVDTGVPGESRFDLTSTGTTVGTVSYMSPEQARGESLDARSDLFSLGVVLYEMATGKLPFQGATSALVFVQLLSHRPEPVRELNAEIPKDFERIISKLLEKNRSDRFQTARDLGQALGRMDSKRSASVKTLWAKSVSRAKKGKDTAAPEADSSSRPQGASPQDASFKASSGSGDSVLRPVKRVTAAELQRSQRESLPPASPPLSTSPLPLIPPSPVTPTAFAKSPATLPSRTVAGDTFLAPLKPASPGPASPSPTKTFASPVLPGALPPMPPATQAPSQTSRQAATDEAWTPRFTSGPSDSMKQRPKPHFERVPTDEEAEAQPLALPIAPISAVSQPRSAPGNKALWIAALCLVVFSLAGAFVWSLRQHRAAPASAVPVSLALGSLNNSTGDDTLVDTVTTGLRFELEQSPALSVRSPAGYEAALRLAHIDNSANLPLPDALRVARTAGVSDLLFGEMTSNGAAYTLVLRVYDVATGARSVDVSETATSREQIPGMLDRLGTDLRSGLGENGDSIVKNTVPLEREATANLDALHSYADGYKLARTGHYMDGIAAFEHAASLDPHFPQAYIRLADLYRRQHAETAAAAAATNAQLSASTASSRTQLLAQAEQSLDTTGDVPHAADLFGQVAQEFPGDMEAHRRLALSERLEGKYSDSLNTAQDLLKLSPWNEDTSASAELDMIALDRVEAAVQLEQQEKNAGLQHLGIAILLNYLHAQNGDSTPPHLAESVDRLGAHAYAASVLDAQGQMAAGLAEWKGIVDRARSEPALASAASYAVSQAALDRALVADCTTSQALIRQTTGMPSGPNTLYALGMAAGLCGNLDITHKSLAALTADHAQDFAAKITYIPNLTALTQWKSGDSAAALDTLKAAKQNDLFSLTPFLRGLILISTHQAQLAIVEFQAMLLHRGATTLTNAVAYPVSQIGLARAYLASGDKGNSASAYKKFLIQWSKADPTNAMMVEARGNS